MKHTVGSDYYCEKCKKSHRFYSEIAEKHKKHAKKPTSFHGYLGKG